MVDTDKVLWLDVNIHVLQSQQVHNQLNRLNWHFNNIHSIKSRNSHSRQLIVRNSKIPYKVQQQALQSMQKYVHTNTDTPTRQTATCISRSQSAFYTTEAGLYLDIKQKILLEMSVFLAYIHTPLLQHNLCMQLGSFCVYPRFRDVSVAEFGINTKHFKPFSHKTRVEIIHAVSSTVSCHDMPGWARLKYSPNRYLG